MKVLYISDNKVNGIGGGSLGAHKAYSCIKAVCEENGYYFKTLTLDESLPERIDFHVNKYKTKKIDMKARLYGHSTFIYFVWKNIKEKLKDFDIVFLGRSRFGFIAKDIKKYNKSCKIITIFENIEFDYAKAYFSREKNAKKFILTFIEMFAAKRDEKDCVINSNEFILLTSRDEKRLRELYKKSNNKQTHIIPVCLEKTIDLKIESDKKTVVFIGSLHYQANISSIMWFLSEVWKKHFEFSDIEFIIAGNRPPKYLKDEISKYGNVALIENFDSVVDFVPKNALMIAPIKEGAGMKVKVAETLSMGLPIAASDEALVGYEEVLGEDGIYRANTADEYKSVIEEYMRMRKEECISGIEDRKELFDKFYTYERVKKCIVELLIY